MTPFGPQSTGSADPQQIIDDMAARAQQMYAQARRQHEELAALAASSTRGAVTVTVAPGGSVQQIAFSGARSETPARLTTTFNEAYREALREVGKATATHSGGLDAEVLAHVPADAEDLSPGRPSHATLHQRDDSADTTGDTASSEVIPDDPEFEQATDKLDFTAAGLEDFRNDPLVRATVPPGEPSSWQQQLTDEVAAISSNASTISELMAGTVGEAESKAIRVVVAVGGAVNEVGFRNGATQLADDKLAAVVTATLRTATTNAATALREAMSAHGVGASDSPTLDALDAETLPSSAQDEDLQR